MSIMLGLASCGQTSISFTPLGSTVNEVTGPSAPSHAVDGGPVCVDETSVATTDTPRLTRTQLHNTVTAIFGFDPYHHIPKLIDSMPNDPEVWSFERISTPLTQRNIDLQLKLASGISAWAFELFNLAPYSIFGDCYRRGPPYTACIDAFADNFAPKILRRPMFASERAVLHEIQRTHPEVSGTFGINNDEAFMLMLSYVLMNPAFYMRWELGNNPDETTTEFQISAYEIASRISFAAINSGPDDILLAKARDGTLNDDAVIRSEVRRLLQTPLARKKFRDFGLYYMKPDLAFDFSELGGLGLPDVNGLAPWAVEETRQFVEYLIWDGNKSFGDLLTSDVSFAAHPGLASIYGHEPSSASIAAGFGQPYVAPGRTTMGPGRKGLFGRLPFLFSPTTRTSLIHRSLKFRAQVLCEDMPPPPPEAFAMRDGRAPNDEEAKILTNRDLVAAMTKSASCMACHATINPSGNIFEGFDSIGRVRTKEKVFAKDGSLSAEIPVDSSGLIPVGDLGEISVTGYTHLTQSLVQSKSVQTCFAQKLVSFTTGRPIQSAESCRARRVYETVRKPGATLMDAIVDAIAEPSIRLKKVAR